MSYIETLRDIRHLDKIIYTLLDREFYRNLETGYLPTGDYFRIVHDRLLATSPPWAVMRDGLWYYVRIGTDLSLPAQGWKIHVSATKHSADSILQRTCEIAIRNQVQFKFALDQNVLCMMNFKRWPRGQSGKFITLYPTNLRSFTALIEELYQALRQDTGPYILSDKRYKDCKVLYYRYGGIAPPRAISFTGTKLSLMTSPDGLSVPDSRPPHFSPPSWAPDPFPGSHSKGAHENDSFLNGRYRVTSALAFSNSGGVYLADDIVSGRTVVLKEARPHTCFDDRNNDAVTLLKREFELLELLKDTGVSPRPVELFQMWEHTYLAEERIESLNFRELILTRTPLLSISPTLEQSLQYHDVFVTVARGLINAIDRLHKFGIVFGDLSPPNVMIDPTTYAVRLVDFEVAHIPGKHRPPYIFTLGFKSPASIRRLAQATDDDLFALASVLVYMMFPIAALSAIREDFFEAVSTRICRDLGWGGTRIPELLTRLAKAEIGCAEALTLLDARDAVTAPQFEAVVDDSFYEAAIQGIGEFILASAGDSSTEPLFPSDPFSYVTNSLGLAFGSCGILYVLKKCGFEIQNRTRELLHQQIDKAASGELPPGLMTGSAGMAWCLWELGFPDRAESLMALANDSPLLSRHHSYLYGRAGVGMANLHLYMRTNRAQYLESAHRLAEGLLRDANESDGLLFWESDDQIHLGLGYGQSGVALFLLRLYQVTGEQMFLLQGRKALAYDFGHRLEIEPGVESFPIRPSVTNAAEPYLEAGTAGILKVAMRYEMPDDSLSKCFEDVHRKYSVFPGLFFGLASCADVLVDAVLLKRDAKYKEMVKRPVAGIRDLYMLSSTNGMAVPGDNLFRISCDYATGAAGVLRTLWRVKHLDTADFMLDELTESWPRRVAPTCELLHLAEDSKAPEMLAGFNGANMPTL